MTAKRQLSYHPQNLNLPLTELLLHKETIKHVMSAIIVVLITMNINGDGENYVFTLKIAPLNIKKKKYSAAVFFFLYSTVLADNICHSFVSAI